MHKTNCTSSTISNQHACTYQGQQRGLHAHYYSHSYMFLYIHVHVLYKDTGQKSILGYTNECCTELLAPFMYRTENEYHVRYCELKHTDMFYLNTILNY